MWGQCRRSDKAEKWNREGERQHQQASAAEQMTPGKEGGGGARVSATASASVQEKLCRRCKKTFEPSLNTPSSCSFHPSFFVSRRHDDQKRYYELGPDDPPYAAKFYDCCGAEDPDAPGCTADFHVSYDE